MTRAERNRNPLNIRKSKETFMGESSISNDKEFKQFINNVYGYRAALKILLTYKKKYKLETIKQIIQRWAPPEDENDTEKYIKFVSCRSGIPTDKELEIEEYPLIIEAMAKMEGARIPNRTEITKAFQLIKF